MNVGGKDGRVGRGKLRVKAVVIHLYAAAFCLLPNMASQLGFHTPHQYFKTLSKQSFSLFFLPFNAVLMYKKLILTR